MTDEFRRFELDLLGVSETHIPGVGSMKLGDIEFVYSGRKDGVHRQGVGLMMNKEAAKSCLGWEGINNRILIAHFMTKKFRVSVIVVYAPIEPTDGDTSDSDEFYLQLQEQIDRVPGRNMVFLLGDFNAQVGRNRDRWYPSLGNFGVGKENSNGYRLLQFCRYNNLVITNTVFGHKMAHKLTWYSRDGKTANLIDYVIVNRRLAGSIQDTRVYRSAVIDVKSKDHHLVVFKVNLKLKFRKSNSLPESYDVGRLQDENLRKKFQEQLSTKLEGLKFDNVEDGWNNFRKTICEVADGVLGKSAKTATRNISEKALGLIESRRGLYKNYLSDRSYENKRNVKKVEKALKYELRRCEMEAMDKIAEDLEDAARRHNSKILYWHVNKLKGSSRSGLVPVKDRNGVTISDKEKVKERWVEHFENVLNQDTVAGKDIDENEKVCDTLDVKEDLFSEEELATVLEGLKNNKAPGADSMINEFLKYGGSEVRNKLLKIMNMIFEKGEVPNDFRKTLIKPLYKKGDKSECRNYRGISLVSVGSKLLSNMILFRLRHAVDKVLREEQCGFRKGRGCVDHVFTLRLIIEKSLRCQTPLVLSFIDYEQAFDSVDRTALTKVLSLYGIPEKYIKVICAMYENNTAAVKVGNEVSNWFCIKSGVKQGCVLSPFIWIILMDFVLRSTGKAIGDHGIKWGGRTLLDLDYADDLSILDESVSKMNEFLEVLRVQGAKIGLKINVKKTKSLRLGISEDEQVTLGNEKIDQVGSFSYLGSIISKDGGSSEDVKSRIAKAQGVFSQLKKVWKNRKISLQTKIRILEATVMTVVKYGSEAWTLQKADENLLDVFQRNCLRIVLGTRLTDRISNSRLYEKCGSIPLSRAIMKERLRWLGHVLRMKDDRLPKIVLFGQPSGATRKAGRPCLGWEDVINKDLKEMGTSWEGVKREALNRLGWRRSVRSCVGLRRLGAAVSY